jgi:hypothetical protein
MPDSLALSAAAVIAAGLIALALVWPQGQGAPSPAPFGHPLAALNSAAPPPPSSPPPALRGPVHVGPAGGKAPKGRP